MYNFTAELDDKLFFFLSDIVRHFTCGLGIAAQSIF